MDKFTDMTIDELDQILNNCLNNAMIRSCRLKQPTNSNDIAKFVSEWLVKNNDVLPLVVKVERSVTAVCPECKEKFIGEGEWCGECRKQYKI